MSKLNKPTNRDVGTIHAYVEDPTGSCLHYSARSLRAKSQTGAQRSVMRLHAALEKAFPDFKRIEIDVSYNKENRHD